MGIPLLGKKGHLHIKLVCIGRKSYTHASSFLYVNLKVPTECQGVINKIKFCDSFNHFQLLQVFLDMLHIYNYIQLYFKLVSEQEGSS